MLLLLVSSNSRSTDRDLAGSGLGGFFRITLFATLRSRSGVGDFGLFRLLVSKLSISFVVMPPSEIFASRSLVVRAGFIAGGAVFTTFGDVAVLPGDTAEIIGEDTGFGETAEASRVIVAFFLASSSKANPNAFF